MPTLSNHLDLATQQISQVLTRATAGKLWLLARSFDKAHTDACGKASFTIAEITAVLGYTRSTIFKYMRSNLFYSKKEVCAKNPSIVLKKRTQFITHKNALGEIVYTLYYKSLEKIKELLEFDKVLFMREGTIDEIGKLRHKRTAYGMAIEYGQNASIKAANSKTVGKKQRKSCNNPNPQKNPELRKPLLSTLDAFGESSSSTLTSPKCDLKPIKKTCGVKSKRTMVLVNVDKVRVMGVSQSYVADITGRHRTTVSRHLKAKESKQIFITSENLVASVIEEFNRFGKKYLVDASGRPFFKFGNTIYRKYTNIYKEEYDNIRSYDSKGREKNTVKYEPDISTGVVLKPFKLKAEYDLELQQRKIHQEIKSNHFNKVKPIIPKQYRTKLLVNDAKFRKILCTYDLDDLLVSTWKLRKLTRKISKKKNINRYTDTSVDLYKNPLNIESVATMLQEFALTQYVDSNSRMQGKYQNKYSTLSNLKVLHASYNTYVGNIDSNALKHHTITIDINLFSRYVYAKLNNLLNDRYLNMSVDFYNYIDLFFRSNIESISNILSFTKIPAQSLE